MYKRIVDPSWDFNTANTKEFTHCYHAYPAMMIPQVARTLIKQYAPKGKCNLLFDPYMGSGTSLVEALLHNINCIGTDINPLARMISTSKITHFQ
jgi:Predicted DNA modification methylase